MLNMELKPDKRESRRKDPKVYRQQFEELLGDEFELLSEYELASIKVTIRHRVCGHVFEAYPSCFLGRPGCQKCHRGNKRIVTPEQFEERFFRIQRDNYRIITPYKSIRKAVVIQHVECGALLKVYPYQTIYPIKCPTCRKEKARITEERFLEQLKKPMYEDYQVQYETYDEGTAVEIKHLTCGEVFHEHPGVFLKKPSCPCCDKEYINPEKFIKNLEERYDGRFKLISAFKGYQYPVCLQHQDPNCMHYSYPFATNISTGIYHCPYCENKKLKDIQHF